MQSTQTQRLIFTLCLVRQLANSSFCGFSLFLYTSRWQWKIFFSNTWWSCWFVGSSRISSVGKLLQSVFFSLFQLNHLAIILLYLTCMRFPYELQPQIIMMGKSLTEKVCFEVVAEGYVRFQIMGRIRVPDLGRSYTKASGAKLRHVLSEKRVHMMPLRLLKNFMWTLTIW